VVRLLVTWASSSMTLSWRYFGVQTLRPVSSEEGGYFIGTILPVSVTNFSVISELPLILISNYEIV
jgi:hypothetical protein